MTSDDVGLSPRLIHDYPEYKSHPNNKKTDQLPIAEVITGLQRPYRNTSPPRWAAYAEIWEIRKNPSPTN